MGQKAPRITHIFLLFLLLLQTTYIVVGLREIIGWVAHTFHSLWFCDSTRRKEILPSMQCLIKTFRCKHIHRGSRLLNLVGSHVFPNPEIPQTLNKLDQCLLLESVLIHTDGLMMEALGGKRVSGWIGLDGLTLSSVSLNPILWHN